MKKIVGFVLAMAICISLSACGGREEAGETTLASETTVPTYVQETQPVRDAVAYHAMMAESMELEVETLLIANRAVTYVEHKGAAAGEAQIADGYTWMYIPEELIAETPEEACYLVRCYHGAEVVGQYVAAGAFVGDNAYRRWVNVSVVDRITGETVRETKFYGGEPEDWKTEGESAFGAYPDETEVSAWVVNVIEEVTAERQSEAVAYAERIVAEYHTSRVRLHDWMAGFGYIKPDYTLTEIEYAVENCDVDWNEVALLALKEEFENQSIISFDSYVSYSSYDGVVEYLVYFEDFTEEEAKYAADHCGADWKEHAVLVAKNYKGQDRAGLIRWLTGDLDNGGNAFTAEEANYAADHYGLK